ncbi:uncharacterized protein [Ptychodera flava]|uniref:uncharacterized protein n=1 Tax=Ptychodera flava TaxID=63121 RepID=UPI003969F702
METKAKPSENPSSRYTVSLDTDTALKTCCHRDQEPRDQKRQGMEESSSVRLDIHKMSCPVADVTIQRDQYGSTQALENSGKARNRSFRNQSGCKKLLCCSDNPQFNNFVTPEGKTVLGHHKCRESEKSCVALYCEEDLPNVEEVSQLDYRDIQGTSDMVCLKERHILKQSNTVSSGKHNCKIFKKPVIPLQSCDDDDETWSDDGRPVQNINSTPKRSRVLVSVRKSHQNVKVVPSKPVCPSENLEYSSNPATKSSTSDESSAPEIDRHSASAQKKKSMIFQHGRMVTPRKAAEDKTFLARRCHSAVTRKNSAAMSTSTVDALSTMKKHNVLSRKRRLHPVNGATASCQSDLPSFTLPQGYKHRKIFVARWMSDSKAQSHFLSTPPKRNLKRQCVDEMWTNQDHFMQNCPGCTVNVERILDSRNYNYWIDTSLKTCAKHRRIRALEKEFIREQNCVPETPVKPIRHVGSTAALNRMKLNFADIVVTPRRRRLNFPSSPSIYDYLGSES